MIKMYTYLLLLLEVSIFPNAVSGGTFCFPDQKLTADGVCVDCEYCPSGEGVDLNEKVAVNSDGIALECRTCRPCQTGYWNNRLFGQMECMKCLLNCEALNRQENKPCGGSSPGLCGPCVNSDYEDNDNNIESPCVAKRPTSVEVKDSTKPPAESNNFSRTQSPEDETVVRPTNEARDSAYYKELELEIGQAVSLAFAGVLLIVLVFIARYLWVHRTRPDSTRCGHKIGMSGDTIASKDSSLLDDVATTAKDNLGKDNDIETDTLLLYNEVDHREGEPVPELPSNMQSSEPDCLTASQQLRRDYPKHLLKIDDDLVTLASKMIYDNGNAKQMFRDLGVSEQDIDAQYELFYHQKCDLACILRCFLNKWIETVGHGATLDVLCRGLDDHDFHKISIELCNIYHTIRQ